MQHSRARLLVATSAAWLLVSGCGDTVGTTGNTGGPSPMPLKYDFGVIPHGEVRSHDFVLDLPGGGAGLAPVGFSVSCSCARWQYLIRKPNGAERAVDNLPRPQKTLQVGDRLVLRLKIDTRVKEAVDLPRTTLKAAILVQDGPGDDPRIQLPLVFFFAIDAPVRVLPSAHVDMGAMPMSTEHYRRILELHPDDGLGPVNFGPLAVNDPRIEATLRDEEGITLVDVLFTPNAETQPGPVRAELHIGTDIGDGYQLNIPVSGQMISDIVVEPFDRISFGRIDLAEPTERFVNVTDHHRHRAPEFEVAFIRDTLGAPSDKYFEARLEPIVGAPGASRLFLRYKGGLEGSGFRGVVRLTKAGGNPPFTDIDYVGFKKLR